MSVKLTIDVEAIEKAARKKISDERAEKATVKITTLLRQIAAAEDVLVGLNQQLADTKQQIADGTF